MNKVRDKICSIEDCKNKRIPRSRERLCEIHIYSFILYNSKEIPLKINKPLKTCPIHGKLKIENIKLRKQRNGSYSQYCSICDIFNHKKRIQRVVDPNETERLCYKM